MRACLLSAGEGTMDVQRGSSRPGIQIGLEICSRSDWMHTDVPHIWLRLALTRPPQQKNVQVRRVAAAAELPIAIASPLLPLPPPLLLYGIGLPSRTNTRRELSVRVSLIGPATLPESPFIQRPRPLSAGRRRGRASTGILVVCCGRSWAPAAAAGAVKLQYCTIRTCIPPAPEPSATPAAILRSSTADCTPHLP